MLQHRQPDPDARCTGCGALAVGPCARCHDPVCGDCCVLTEGSNKVFAICLPCEERGGRSLAGAWRSTLLWIAAPIVALALLLLLLQLAFGRG